MLIYVIVNIFLLFKKYFHIVEGQIMSFRVSNSRPSWKRLNYLNISCHISLLKKYNKIVKQIILFLHPKNLLVFLHFRFLLYSSSHRDVQTDITLETVDSCNNKLICNKESVIFF